MTATLPAAGRATWQQRIPHAPVSIDVTRPPGDTIRSGGRGESRGAIVAVAGAEGGCWLLDATTGQPRAELELAGGALSVSFSPDGQLLAVCGPTGFLLARVGDAAILHSQSAGWCAGAAWARRRVAIAAGRRVLVLDTAAVDEATPPVVVQTSEDLPSTVTAVRWTREGRSLLAAAYGGVYAFQRHSPRPTHTYAYLGSHLALAVPATERWFCTGNQDRSVHIWRARDGEQLQMGGYPSKISRLVFDDTGRWLAVDGAPDVTVWDFAGAGPRGTRPRELTAHAAITALAWEPGSGAVLASYGSEGHLAIWHPAAQPADRLQTPSALRDFDADSAVLRWLAIGVLLVADRGGTLTCLTGL